MGTAKPSGHAQQHDCHALQPSGHALVLLGVAVVLLYSVTLVLRSPIIRGAIKYHITKRKLIIIT